MPGGINVPLDVIISWPTPNYQNPVTQPKYVLIFSCVVGPISIALLCARLWVRVSLQRNAGLDDWLMLAAAPLMLVLTVIFPLVTQVYRFDRHAWDVEYKYFPMQRKFVMAIYILFSLTSGLIKLSILLFYRRLSSRTVSPAFRWTMRITIFAIGAYSIAFMIIPIFMCRPISAFWNQVDFSKVARGYEYTCINEGIDVVAHGIVSTVQDLIVAFLPTLLCWNLQIPRRQKIALYVIFALGYSSVAIGAMRTYQGYRLFFTTYDVTWVASDIWLWSLLELHIGSMCANAPALKTFFDKLLKVDRQTSPKRSKARSRLDRFKKQVSPRSVGAASTDTKFKSRNWYGKLFRSVRCGSTDSSRFYMSHPRPVTAAHVEPSNPNRRDSMTKPLASEYINTMIGHDSYAKVIEMSSLPQNQASLDDRLQAIPPYQIPAPAERRRGHPPPLSQMRTSWSIEGRRYVWRPWERSAGVQRDAEHSAWV